MNATDAQPPITFQTNQGKVTLEFHDNDLLILEGYDDKVAENARQALLNGVSAPQAAGNPNK
jgi:hypothetical protein